MALLRPCRRLMQTFIKMPTTCQVQFMQRFNFNPKRSGYVDPQQQRIYSNNERKDKSVLNNILENNNGLTAIEMRNCLDVLSNGFTEMRVEYEVLLDALKIYATLSDNVTDSDSSMGVFLLHCCGEVLPDIKQEVRRKLTQHVWNLLEKKYSLMSLDYYHTLLNVCAQNCQEIDPEEFLKSMTTEPDESTYISLLNVAAKTQDLDSVNFLLRKIKEKKYSLNQEALSALIEMHWAMNDMASANSIVETISSTGIKPQDEIYGSLACGYALQGDIQSTINLLESHSLGNKYLLGILRNLSLSNEGNIQKIFHYLATEKMISDPLLTNIIIELIHLGKVEAAFSIVNYFTTKQAPNETLNLVKHFMKALVRARIPVSTILRFSMEFSKRYTPSVVFYNLYDEALRSAHSELALILLEDMKTKNIEIRSHYYWPLLLQASKKKGESGVFKIVDHALNMNVQLDHNTLLDYVIPHISTSDPQNTLKKFKYHGIPQAVGLTSLICYLLNKGQLIESLLLYNTVNDKMNFNNIIIPLIKTYEITKDADGCTKLLKYANREKDFAGTFLLQLLDNKTYAKKTAVLKEFINTFVKHNVLISNTSVELITEKLGSIEEMEEIINLLTVSDIVDGNCQKSVSERLSGIPHPKDMNNEELECHLIELKSKGFNVRGVLRKLFMIHCKNNNLKRVEEIKEEFEKNDMPLTLGMKAQLLDLYARHGRVDDVCAIVLDLQENYPDFKIDPSKILRAATAIVQHNKVEMAVEIIKNTRTVSFSVPRGCWELLNAIAHSEKSELTDSTLNILIDQGFCTVSTTLLGPVIRRHLVKNDLPTAVAAFKMIAQTHKKTPLRQELVSILVEASKVGTSREEYESMLKEVLDEIVPIHGNDTVEIELIIAYARCEMLQNLQSTLQNLAITEIPLEKFTNAMPDDVKVKVLTTILDASHGVRRIDRQSIYDLLLSINCRMGNCQDAMKLWEKMKDEGIEPSTIFKMNFVNLLRMDKVQLPHGLNTKERI